MACSVAIRAQAAWHGPYWAVLVSTVGVGGWTASRVPFARSSVAPLLGVAALAAAVLPVAVSSLGLVIAEQIIFAMVVTIVSVRAGFLMHGAVAATVRAGVSSGAGTLSWSLFVPASLLFDWLSNAHGVQTAGWLLVMMGAALAVLSPTDRGCARRRRRGRRPVIDLLAVA